MDIIRNTNFKRISNGVLHATYQINGTKCSTFIKKDYNGMNRNAATERLAKELGALTLYQAHIEKMHGKVRAGMQFCIDNGQARLADRLENGFKIEWPSYIQPAEVLGANSAIGILNRNVPSVNFNTA